MDQQHASGTRARPGPLSGLLVVALEQAVAGARMIKIVPEPVNAGETMCR